MTKPTEKKEEAEKCPECEGDGTCKFCGGSGKDGEVDCSECDGDGDCMECGGSGKTHH